MNAATAVAKSDATIARAPQVARPPYASPEEFDSDLATIAASLDTHGAAALAEERDGPFATATEGEENKSKRGEPLPYVAPPEGMFPDVREETDGPPVDDAH